MPFGAGAAAEHLEMVAAVHVLDPQRPRGRRARAASCACAPRTMAAEGVLHDLGVIPMMSSDSQGMGRIGEVVRRIIQGAARHEARARRGAGPGDNERVLRYLAKVAVNPAITHGLADHVGSLQPGRLADAVLWHPHLFAVRPELVAKAGHRRLGRLGRRQRDDGARRADPRRAA